MAIPYTFGNQSGPIPLNELDANFAAVPTSTELTASTGSTLIGTIQSGTGSVTRTVASKLDDVVSVKDFGAVGDNVTDDTIAFTNAVSSGQMVFAQKPSVNYKFGLNTQPGKATIFLDPSSTWEQSTNNGNLNILRGTRPNSTEGANIWRFTDRVFIGDAAAYLSGNTSANPGTSWIGDVVNYAGYLGLNGKLVVASTPEYNDIPYMIVAGVRTSDTQQEAIGIGVTVVADSANSAWGAIYELQLEADSQMIGIEIGAKNKNSFNTTMTPNAQTTGVFGLWLAGGGDNAFGGSSVNPSTAGIAFVKNTNTWNSGIVFMKDSLTSGSAISMSSEGIGGAHRLSWYSAVGSLSFFMQSSNSTADSWSLRSENDGVNVYKDTSRLLSIGGAASAVNGITIYGGATGAASLLTASGSDTNIDLQLSGKGTGVIKLGSVISMSSEIGGANRLSWYSAVGSLSFFMQGTNSTADSWSLRSENDGVNVYKNAGRLFSVGGAASAVNGITIYGGATGAASLLAATGSDTNIDLQLSGKGTGVIKLGYASTLATTPASFSPTRRIAIKDSSGTVYYVAASATAW